MGLQFGFVIFWQKDFGRKAANKMLVKLTPGQWQRKKFYNIGSWCQCYKLFFV